MIFLPFWIASQFTFQEQAVMPHHQRYLHNHSIHLLINLKKKLLCQYPCKRVQNIDIGANSLLKNISITSLTVFLSLIGSHWRVVIMRRIENESSQVASKGIFWKCQKLFSGFKLDFREQSSDLWILFSLTDKAPLASFSPSLGLWHF